MANPNQKVPGNVDGDFFVDTTCIDCDTCRWVAPDTFDQGVEYSKVHRQPANDSQREAALLALLACPTGSIGCSGDKSLLKKVRGNLPLPFDGEVHYCAYHSAKSYGGASWFIRRPEGNVLIDSPRYEAGLAKSIRQMGGIQWMWLSHRDDVADHAKWAKEFGCRRVLHMDDVLDSTKDVEVKLEGLQPFDLDDQLKVIPVPGHSKGHTCLLYKDQYLFTGDHLAYDWESKSLEAFADYTWYSWDEQILSMKRLEAYDFEWVLPGHGRWGHLPLPEMKQAMQKCIAWMEKQ